MSMWQNKKALLHACVVTLLSFIKQPKSEKSSLPFWFNQFLEYFTKPEYVKAGIPSIIEKANYNRIYLCRVFKKYMNVTMTEYLNQTRLNYAETYLRNTNMTITNICSELGFSSSSYFEKMFKNKYNMTPSKYKSAYKKQI